MNKGFIAITISLSVAGILLALVALQSIDSAIFFDLAQKKEYRAMNYHNAANCINQAILELASDYFFTVNQAIVIPYLNCSILSMEFEGNLRKIKTRGDYKKAYVYRSATLRLEANRIEIIKVE